MAPGHSFKVVFINETDEVEPIPHQWEKDGTLFWPPSKKEIRKNQSNPESAPDENTWLKYSCNVKATNIFIFSHASAKADAVCLQETTDEEISTSCKKRLDTRSVNQNNCYDSYFDQGSPEQEAVVPLVTAAEASADAACMSYVVPETHAEGEGVQDVAEVKASMQHQLAEISAKQDGLEQLLKNHHCEASSKLDEVNIFPLSTIEDVVNLENYLNDVANNTKIIAHLKRVTGSGQQWKSVCYKLSAILFTKDILTKYSWTGVSRTGTGKNPFNKLVNILDVFYKVVFFSDNTFTHMNKEFFLKDCILKHSRSRLHPKKTVSKAKTTVEAEHDGEVQAEAN